MKRLIRAPKRRLALSIAALAAVGALAGSFAAFTASTSNDGNTISTGNIHLINDVSGTAASGAALFNIGTMGPGDTYTRCINITNDGTLGLRTFQMKVNKVSSSLTGLNIKVEQGSGAGVSPSCTGFVHDASVDVDDTLNALDGVAQYVTDATPGTIASWGPSASKSYRVTASLPANNTETNASAVFNLVWSATY